MKTLFDQNELDRMRNDPDNYKWGIFYFNPNDPRTIVPKRNYWLGLTFNFAKPYSYLIFLSIFIVIELMANLDKIIELIRP